MHDTLHKKSGKKLKSHVMQCNVSVNDREGEPHWQFLEFVCKFYGYTNNL